MAYGQRRVCDGCGSTDTLPMPWLATDKEEWYFCNDCGYETGVDLGIEALLKEDDK